MTTQNKIYLGIICAMALSIGALIAGVIVPSVDVIYDGRTGNCIRVFDHAAGQPRECGWEEGKRFTATIIYPNG